MGTASGRPRENADSRAAWEGSAGFRLAWTRGHKLEARATLREVSLTAWNNFAPIR